MTPSLQAERPHTGARMLPGHLVAGSRDLLLRLLVLPVLLVAGCLGTAVAGPRTSDLRVYFEKVKALYREAEITGEFYDWRTTSRYRSHAGLHLGYDIALNAGRGVPAGWSGRVVDIVPWTDNEFGVCVECPNGYRVTYGHISPTATLGQAITPGQIVGTIVRDHVDIKVRDHSGGYFDFGQSFGILDGSSPWSTTAGGLLPPPPDEGGLPSSSGVNLEALYAQFRDAQARYQACRSQADQTRGLVDSLNRYIDAESNGLPQAEQQLLAWHRAADSNAVSPAQVEALELQVESRRIRVNRLIYILEQRQVLLRERLASLHDAEGALQAVRSRLAGTQADAKRLQEIEARAVSSAASLSRPEPNETLTSRAQKARERVRELRARYEIGAAAQAAVDEAQREADRLQVAETLWSQGDKDAARGLNY